MKHAFICLFSVFFLTYGLVAQTAPGHLVWQAKEIKMPTAHQKNGVKFFGLMFQLPKTVPLFSVKQLSCSLPIFPCNYYAANLGWVCKQEWKMEKKTLLPLRFRLGSTEQVDYLEGKSLGHLP